MSVYEKHIEVLELFGDEHSDRPFKEACRAAIDLMRAVEPMTPMLERGHCSRVAYEIAEAGTDLACAIADVVMRERSAVRAQYAEREHVIDMWRERCAVAERRLAELEFRLEGLDK